MTNVSPRDLSPGDLQLDGDGPLYLQIKRAITAAVRTGKVRPGERIPSETALMARFRTSRMTVHKALSQLAAEGLLARNRKAGTIVSPPGRERAVFEIWDASLEAARAGLPYRFETLERAVRPATAADAGRLGVAPGAPVLWLLGRHIVDGRVVQVEERLVHLAMADGLAAADLAAMPPGRWLLDKVPWTEAEHAITAVNAGAALAARLEVPAGTAALMVERRTWHGTTPVTAARLWHAGDHVLVGRFAPTR